MVGGGGDYLCLDYSENSLLPKVVFYFHELGLPDGLFEVADSFSSLLGMLQEER
ncbi:SMI1/KNR4 family protein [Pseudomonas sp. QD4]|uniref:SMI1/KNR4 family protein n=1 Tax=Pseudomonas sp. QD4 TaxID=3368618 RepID=UPI003BA17822